MSSPVARRSGLQGIALTLVIAGVACPRLAAQTPIVLSGGVGMGAFDGMHGESGGGLQVAADVRRKALRLDIAVLRVWPLAQTCTLGVPGSCSPETPPPNIMTASLLWQSRGSPYLAAGAGGVWQGSTQRHGATLRPALDVRAGVGLSRSTAIELGAAAAGGANTTIVLRLRVGGPRRAT